MSSQSQEYLLFAGENYHAAGGWLDYIDTFYSLSEAKEYQHGGDWAHIVFDGKIRWIYFDAPRFTGDVAKKWMEVTLL